MAISTLEIVFVVLGFIAIGIGLWYFIIAKNYTSHLSQNSYARGANATAPATLNMACDDDHQICVSSVTQICTVPTSSNFEGSNLEPISGGQNSAYGAFDPKTTVNMTATVANECDGKQTCAFNYSSDVATQGWQTINATGNNACNGQTQIIANYVCVPKGQSCTSPYSNYTTAYAGNYYYTADSQCILATDRLAWGWTCKNSTTQDIKLWMVGNTTDENCSYNFGFEVATIPANSTLNWQQTATTNEKGVKVYNSIYQNCRIWAQTASGASYSAGPININTNNVMINVYPASNGISISDVVPLTSYYNKKTNSCAKITQSMTSTKIPVYNLLASDVTIKIKAALEGSNDCTSYQTLGVIAANNNEKIYSFPNAAYSITASNVTKITPIIISQTPSALYVCNALLYNTNQNPISDTFAPPKVTTPLTILTDIPPFSLAGITPTLTNPSTYNNVSVPPTTGVGYIMQGTNSDTTSITSYWYNPSGGTKSTGYGIGVVSSGAEIWTWNTEYQYNSVGTNPLYPNQSIYLYDATTLQVVGQFSVPSNMTSDMLLLIRLNGLPSS